MITAIKRIVSKDIVKVFSLTAVSTVIRMLTGLISVKIISVLIGPAGIALLGQLNNFSTIFLTISTGGINSGVTKYVAEYSHLRDQIVPYLRTGLWITLIMSIVSGLTLIVGANYFSLLILHDTQYVTIIVILGFTIVLYSLNGFLLSILNGFKEYSKFVYINIYSSIIGLIISLFLAFTFGVFGALLSVVTFQSFALVITFIVVYNCPWFRWSNFAGRFSQSALKKLAQYSLMAFVSAATLPVAQLIIRSSISSQISLNDAGLWEGINRISAMYLMVVTSSLSVYYLPRLSEITDGTQLRLEILDTYKIILPSLFLMLLVIYFLRNTVVDVLFNDNFNGIQSLFAFQLVGDFFKICSWILAFQMVAKSMTITYVVTEIIFGVLYVVLALISIGSFGTIGATIGYAISSFIYFLTIVVIFRTLIFTV